MQRSNALTLALMALTCAPVVAQDSVDADSGPIGDKLSTYLDFSSDKNAKWLKAASIKPALLQAKDGSGSALGLSYVFATKPLVKDMTAPISIGQPTDGSSQIASFELVAKGTYASRPAVNVDNVLDLTSSGSWLYVSNGHYFKSAFSAGYAAQQGNAQRSSRWELSQAWGTWLRGWNDTELLGRVALARMQPGKDAAREAALQSNPRDYKRWEAEVMAIIPLKAMGGLKKIELRHLMFREPGAPQEIRAAGLDRSRVTSVYFGLQGGLFVGYSKGGVPADRQDSQVLKVGWSSNAL